MYKQYVNLIAIPLQEALEKQVQTWLLRHDVADWSLITGLRALVLNSNWVRVRFPCCAAFKPVLLLLQAQKEAERQRLRAEEQRRLEAEAASRRLAAQPSVVQYGVTYAQDAMQHQQQVSRVGR